MGCCDVILLCFVKFRVRENAEFGLQLPQRDYGIDGRVAVEDLMVGEKAEKRPVDVPAVRIGVIVGRVGIAGGQEGHELVPGVHGVVGEEGQFRLAVDDGAEGVSGCVEEGEHRVLPIGVSVAVVHAHHAVTIQICGCEGCVLEEFVQCPLSVAHIGIRIVYGKIGRELFVEDHNMGRVVVHDGDFPGGEVIPVAEGQSLPSVLVPPRLCEIEMGNPVEVQYVAAERVADGVVGGGEDRGEFLIPTENGFLHPLEHIAARGRDGGVSAENGCDLNVVGVSHVGVPRVDGIVEGISGQLLDHNVNTVPVCVFALVSAHSEGHGVSVVIGGG